MEAAFFFIEVVAEEFDGESEVLADELVVIGVVEEGVLE